MRIINIGMIEENIMVCSKCKTVFGYFSRDIQTSAGFGISSGWVECPACGEDIILWKRSM